MQLAEREKEAETVLEFGGNEVDNFCLANLLFLIDCNSGMSGTT